jgi:hypothetical protein
MTLALLLQAADIPGNERDFMTLPLDIHVIAW